MYILDLTLPTPEENLALDASLLQTESKLIPHSSAECLRFWESPVECVVVGYSSRIEQEVHFEVCDQARIPVLRRVSGGGTVLLGPGCLNFALVLSLELRPELLDIRKSWRIILGALAQSLDYPGVAPAGTCDLTLHGRKFSGNAQRRTRQRLLHHGTVLYAFNLRRVGQLLKEPSTQPPYRLRRTHEDFLRNLPLCASDIKRRITDAWRAFRIQEDQRPVASP